MAAGATLSGVGQTFKLGSTPVVSAHTQRWNVTFESADTEYATNSTAGWNEVSIGVKRWEGTCRFLVHAGGAIPVTIGTEYEAQLHIDGGGSDYFSGTIKVLKSETVADSESSDPIGYDVTFKGHGALTKAGSKLVV